MPTERIRRTFTHADEQGNIVESREEIIIKREEHEKPTRGSQFKQKALDKTPTKLKNPSNLQVRVRTGAVYITLTVLCIIASDATTAIYLAALSAICAGEFYYMLRSDAKLPNEVLGFVASASFPLAMWLFGINGVVVMVSLFIIVLLVWYVFWLHARIVDVAVSLFGAFYTGLLMSAAMLIRMSVPDYWGGVLILGIFASVWGNDAFAYLIGSKFGKHKMTPQVSPKKTWEGFFAGLIFSMAFWCLFPLIPGVEMNIVQSLVFGAICGVLGVIGDLVESRIKRNAGFKDSGTIGGECAVLFLKVTAVVALEHCLPYRVGKHHVAESFAETGFLVVIYSVACQCVAALGDDKRPVKEFREAHIGIIDSVT